MEKSLRLVLRKQTRERSDRISVGCFKLGLAKGALWCKHFEITNADNPRCIAAYTAHREKHLSQNPPEPGEALSRAVQSELTRLAGKSLAGGLYLIATPIGNLADITLRALHVLANADVIYCEDTRTSSRLTQHYAISAPLRPFHDHNEEAEQPRVLRQVAEGRRVALISDAGMPLVSDPGFKLVRACAQERLPVTCIPGPSAVLTALATSGIPTDQFTFAGFLPPKPAARRTRLADLKSVRGTLVFFEAPQRTPETLDDMASVLGDRTAAVARELTKMHEEMARGSLSSLASSFAAREVKGEIVIVVGPPQAQEANDETIEAHLAQALASMKLKDAAAAVSDALGVSKSRVYAIGLKIKREPGEHP